MALLTASAPVPRSQVDTSDDFLLGGTRLQNKSKGEHNSSKSDGYSECMLQILINELQT